MWTGKTRRFGSRTNSNRLYTPLVSGGRRLRCGEAWSSGDPAPLIRNGRARWSPRSIRQRFPASGRAQPSRICTVRATWLLRPIRRVAVHVLPCGLKSVRHGPLYPTFMTAGTVPIGVPRCLPPIIDLGGHGHFPSDDSAAHSNFGQAYMMTSIPERNGELYLYYLVPRAACLRVRTFRPDRFAKLREIGSWGSDRREGYRHLDNLAAYVIRQSRSPEVERSSWRLRTRRGPRRRRDGDQGLPEGSVAGYRAGDYLDTLARWTNANSLNALAGRTVTLKFYLDHAKSTVSFFTLMPLRAIEHMSPAAARGMGVDGKPEGMNGRLAPALRAEGKRKLLRYVGQDVRTTLDLAPAASPAAPSAGSPVAARCAYDFGRGMAGGGGGSFVAVARHLLDGRAVAEGEVHGVDAYSTSIPCSIASFAPAGEIRMTMCPSLLGTISSTRMSTAICVRPAVVAGSHDFRITRPLTSISMGLCPFLASHNSANFRCTV